MASPLIEVAKFGKSLVRGAGEAASSAKPFYSNIDQAIAAITQSKGTGEQMLAQILKTKGVAAELKYRPEVKAALMQPKVTKEQLQKVAADNPPPQIFEKIDKGPSASKYTVEHDELNDKYDVVDDYSDVVKSFRDYNDANFYADNLKHGTTTYQQYQLPGGKNYREIKIIMPTDNYKLKLYKVISPDGKDESPYNSLEKALKRAAEINGRVEERQTDIVQGFKSKHFREPNVLAHARVSDRTGPNGEKILHVEEIQSDWHQKGRKEGYGKPPMKGEVRIQDGYDPVRADQFEPEDTAKTWAVYWEDGTYSGGYGSRSEAERRLSDVAHEKAGSVPDAPFKENWHELVMKRLLDDAVKKGYDKVVVTPAAEQLKRYPGTEKHFGEMSYKNNPDGTMSVLGNDKTSGLANLHEEDFPKEDLVKHVGKELAERIMAGEGNPYAGTSRLRAGTMNIPDLDIKTGGQFHKDFYDTKIPSFLNSYGKQYGAKVGEYNLPVAPKNSSDVKGYTLGQEYMNGQATWPEFLAANPRAAEEFVTKVHSFDITPQMRQSIIEKGQPLNQIIPAGVGAEALVGQQEEATEQPTMKRGGAVGMDAMRMALMNQKVQHKQVGGISRIRRMMAGAPNKTTNIIKEGGGNWLAGGVEKGLKGLKRDDTPVLPITEAEITAMRNAGYTVHDPVTGLYSKPNPTNQFIDKQITKYIKNQMGTREDPIRLAADAFPAQKAKLLAAKQVQIDKATADMEKAQQSRGFTPDMMTRSQARIRELQKEKELIDRREGMHFNPFEIQEPSQSKLMQKRMDAGMTAKPLGETENAKNWENLVDRSIQPSTARDFTEGSLYPEPLASNPWLYKVSPEAKVYDALDLHRGLGFDHMMDELRNATNAASGLPKDLLIDPKDLSKWTMAQAAEHVDKINAYRASQKAEADVVRANNAATVLHKDYPEKGMRWVELRLPENMDLPEGYKVVKYEYPNKPTFFSVTDPEGITQHEGQVSEEAALKAYAKSKGHPALESALKYEGEQLQHCVGGYCPDVISGKSRIYSLRDTSSGKPHATAEVKPGKTWSEKSGIFYDNPELEAPWRKFSDDSMLAYSEKGLPRPTNYILQYPEWLKANDPEMFAKYANVFESAPPKISQIKGMSNRAPSEEYLPYIQDFVKSGKWSDVGDLRNTGLVKTSPEVIEHYTKQGKTAPAYMTEGEHAEASNAALDNFLQSKTNPQEPEGGMKDGGFAHLDKGVAPETPEQELQRFLRMFRINASGGKDQYGSSVGGRLGLNIPVNESVSIEPYVRGFAYKPENGNTLHGGVGGANLNIRFNSGGKVSDDAMRLAIMSKQLRKHHG